MHLSAPGLAELVRWSRAVLDAHVTTALFNSDCAMAVQAIQKEVRKQVKICAELAPLKGFLLHLTTSTKRSRPLPKVPEYSIEVLHL